MDNNERQIPREKLREMAEELLDAIGIQKVERTDEEREVIRRAIGDYKRRKAEREKKNVE